MNILPKRSVRMPRQKLPLNFFARLTHTFTSCASWRCVISLCTGPRQRPDLAIHQFTRRIHAGEPIEQFGGGTSRRDYTYIDDVIQGTMAALQYEGPHFDIFNLGESETIQLKDLIVAIENAVGKKAKINQLPEQPGDMPLTCANISKARELLGYNPTIRLSEGLPKFIDWFLRWQKK